MNRYYDDPYKDIPHCGFGNHGDTFTNGRCKKCGTNVSRERESVQAKVASGMVKEPGKHRKDTEL